MDAMPELRMPRPLGVVIHPLSVVDPAAILGRDVRIGPFCTVGPDVVIEDGAELMSHVVVDGHTRIGAGARLFPFCSVGLAPQDLKYKGEPTRCEIGARTQVRENCTIHRGTATGRGVTTVGDDCMLMAVVHVAHDCIIGDGVAKRGVRLDRTYQLNTGGNTDFLNMSNRGRLASLNVIGLRRRGFDRAAITALHAAFDLMFKGEGVFSQRLEETRERYGAHPLVAEVLSFIDQRGRRGLIRTQWTRPDAEASDFASVAVAKVDFVEIGLEDFVF